MGKEQKWRQHPGKSKAITAAVVIVFGVLYLTLLWLRMNDAEKVLPSLPEAVESVKDPDNIAIPGFEAITLAAGEKRQKLEVYNPAENSCYFKISLLLSDGTLLWQSELIPPGKQTNVVKLLLVPEKGTYKQAVLRYECFSLEDGKTPMNSAETILTLFVK